MTDFLHKVDKLTAAMNKEQLVCFIHNEARLLNENERDEFLTRLGEFADAPAKKTTYNQPEKAHDEIIENLSSIYKQIDGIKNGEAVLTSEYNEEYDDWYNDEVDLYIYQTLLMILRKTIALHPTLLYKTQITPLLIFNFLRFL